MAIFFWHINSYDKGAAANYSAYVSRRGAYSTRGALVASWHGNLPEWANDDPVAFWEAADLFERRKGSACREILLALPNELGVDQWIRMVERVVEEQVGSKPYQCAIHLKEGDVQEHTHPHAHILYSDRIPDSINRPPERFFSRFNAKHPELGGRKKDSGGRSPLSLRLEVLKRKSGWESILNDALAAGGYSTRVDRRAQAELNLQALS